MLTNLYAKNHDILLVKDFVGHKNVKTTELYIQHDKDKVFDKVSELIDKHVKRQKI